MKKVLICIFVAALATAMYTQLHGQTVSAVQAREAALAMTGGGAISSLELVTDPALGSVFQIVIVNNAVRYEVSVNAATGEVFRLTSVSDGVASVTVSPQPFPQQGVAGNIVPRPPRRPGGPANPPISAEGAVEIAHNHLLSLGITNARLDYIYMDIERGRWVWSVEFDGPRGVEYEFYIDVNTGTILQFQIDR